MRHKGPSLHHAGSFFTAASGLLVVLRLCFPSACGTLAPQLGIEPMSPALQGRFLTTVPLGKSLNLQFFSRSAPEVYYHAAISSFQIQHVKKRNSFSQDLLFLHSYYHVPFDPTLQSRNYPISSLPKPIDKEILSILPS